MSTVDDAVVAGAWELAKGEDARAAKLLAQMMQGDDPDLFTHNVDRALTTARAAWPILSAPLRKLHTRWDQGGGWVVCMHCNANTRWPCETITEIDRIDRELGIETDKELG